MNAKQQLIAVIGIFLIGLTVWFHWKDDIHAMLFNAVPADSGSNAGGSTKEGVPKDKAVEDYMNRNAAPHG